MTSATGTEVDIALRIFGVTLLTFPLWTGAVRYYINEKTADRDSVVGEHSALTLTLTYVMLLGAMVGAAGPLLEEVGPSLDVAILLAEAFAILVGAGTMASLVKIVDSDFDARVVEGLMIGLWLLALYLTMAVYDISLF